MNGRRWRVGTRRNKRYARKRHNGITQRSDWTNPTYREARADIGSWFERQYIATIDALIITGEPPEQIEPPAHIGRTAARQVCVYWQEHQRRRGRLNRGDRNRRRGSVRR